ncbi:hypothetical protein [Enhydrobacter sp.]|jgi:hypothetical protein|uniref:hypothetical protein n=1 Tax=Enhydrobacter sp. TaxID=1894999 RepID=UPI00262A722F|nr:hypothetical protein [Enhydrobacter sp.]
MKRLRLLAGLLGCLAVVAAGLPTVAYAWMPSGSPASHAHTTVSALCSQHCPECEGMPCPPTAAGCVVACIGTMPSLVAAVAALPLHAGRGEIWPVRLATLRGLSPPPDPSPPRS